jgi:hypothetical protein
MPFFLARSFTASREIWAIENVYRDGERQLELMADTSKKSFTATMALTASQLTAMRNFYLSMRGAAFWFYYGPECNYTHDPSGVQSDGRYLCVFLSSWEQVVNIGRSEAQIHIQEVN